MDKEPTNKIITLQDRKKMTDKEIDSLIAKKESEIETYLNFELMTREDERLKGIGGNKNMKTPSELNFELAKEFMTERGLEGLLARGDLDLDQIKNETPEDLVTFIISNGWHFEDGKDQAA